MTQRPDITTISTAQELRRWYWLRAELEAELKRRNLPRVGNKHILLDSLAHFLDSGEVLRQKSVKPTSGFDWHTAPLTPQTLITDSYRNSQNVRRFFKSQVGEKFKFNRRFMAWMLSNSGKTLADAVAAYQQQMAEAADPNFRSEIAPDNQFNRYTREFLDDNPHLGMDDVRRVWARKRALPSEDGKHVYARSDLELP
ncbi:DUF6434 domain-containing protein [uncultured Sulfitobacter sp.]|uniref:DUF6434 domain-containing protein n=1 Tax=uncultured Sulfitobacter sp. TaxID=191468 RepID=UPI002608B225|nr:DUF6434 domain-containing protein [uncultured Sulfitobacter sp.]